MLGTVLESQVEWLRWFLFQGIGQKRKPRFEKNRSLNPCDKILLVRLNKIICALYSA